MRKVQTLYINNSKPFLNIEALLLKPIEGNRCTSFKVGVSIFFINLVSLGKRLLCGLILEI